MCADPGCTDGSELKHSIRHSKNSGVKFFKEGFTSIDISSVESKRRENAAPPSKPTPTLAQGTLTAALRLATLASRRRVRATEKKNKTPDAWVAIEVSVSFWPCAAAFRSILAV